MRNLQSDSVVEHHLLAADRPTTLLEGFGEATEQVVALRAQLAQLDQANVTLSAQNTDLASENAHARVNLAHREQEAVVAFHEQKRLRAALTRLVELGRDDGAAPDDAWKRAWKQADAALSTRADGTEGEASEPLSSTQI